MRVLRPGLLLVVLLIPTAGQAGDHEAEAFLAPSYLMAKGSTSHLGGWHVAGAKTLPKEKRLSLVGDISAHFFTVPGTSDGGKDLTQITLMVGPRWTFIGGKRGMPFAHVMLLGAVYRSDGRLQVSNSSGAMAFGGGLDFVPGTKSPCAPGAWGVRVQGDYIWPVATDLKWSMRVSVGGIYRFHHEHPCDPNTLRKSKV